MTSERVFVNEMDQAPSSIHIGDGASPRKASPISFEEAVSMKSNMLSPEYLPAGYVLEDVALLSNGAVVLLVYGNTTSHGHLHMLQGGSLSPDGVTVKRGKFDRTSLQSGNNAHIVRGGWGQVVRAGGSAEVSWNEDESKSLFFERAEGLIVLLGMPASEWPDNELKNVAESLAPA